MTQFGSSVTVKGSVAHCSRQKEEVRGKKEEFVNHFFLLPLICLPNMKLLSQEQRQEIRDLCREIVRRNVELSADKVLQQLKSEYCCPEGRAPLPDVWTAHNIEIKTKRLDSNNYNCFYCTSNNTAIHNTLDPVRSLSKQPNTVQQYNKEKNWIGTREAECSTSSSDPPFNCKESWLYLCETCGLP